jgi:hypothetical protein
VLCGGELCVWAKNMGTHEEYPWEPLRTWWEHPKPISRLLIARRSISWPVSDLVLFSIIRTFSLRNLQQIRRWMHFHVKNKCMSSHQSFNWVHYRFRKSYDAFEYLTRNHTVLTWGFPNATRQHPAPIRENLLTQTPSTDLIRLQLSSTKWW